MTPQESKSNEAGPLSCFYPVSTCSLYIYLHIYTQLYFFDVSGRQSTIFLTSPQDARPVATAARGTPAVTPAIADADAGGTKVDQSSTSAVVPSPTKMAVPSPTSVGDASELFSPSDSVVSTPKPSSAPSKKALSRQD